MQTAQATVTAICSPEDPSWPASALGERLGLQAAIHRAQGQYEQALALNTEQRAILPGAVGETRGPMSSEDHLCVSLNLLGRCAECIALARAVIAREAGRTCADMPNLFLRLMTAQTDSGAIGDARQTLRQAMPGWRRNGIVFLAGGPIAAVLAELGRWVDAARVGAAAIAFQHRTHRAWHPSLQRANARWQSLLAAAPGDADEPARWQREGQALDEAAIEAIRLRLAEPQAGR